MNKKFSLFFISILCVAFLAGKVLALEVTYPTIFDQSINSTSSAEDYVCYLFGLIMNLAFFVSVLVIVFGGLYYLASLSRGKFTDEGKSYIKSGIYGLLIVVCSALIIYTINPSLNKCSFGAMSLISDVVSEISDTSTTTQDVITFKEIPIGTLTENLLSRKIDCYAFDQNGNPVPGDGSTGDEIQPTLRNHDRADCITQLMEGAQNKANVIASLTKEINSLMEECRCDDSKCSPSNLACSEGSGCELLGQGVAYGSGGQCTSSGSCEGICCEENTGCTGQDCCDTETRDKIEGNNNSTISVSVQVGEGETEEVEYNGLNEFRCPNPDANGGYAECYNVASSGVERSAITKEGNPVSIINKKNWDKLSLIQQLSYFGEKLDYTNESSIGKMIDDDKDLLNEARETLSNCYLAISYIDLLKKRDSKEMSQYIFLTDKPFIDPLDDEKPIDSSTYCKGFNYDNSSCWQECNNMCPDINAEYGSCAGSTDSNCLQNAFNNRPCTYFPEVFCSSTAPCPSGQTCKTSSDGKSGTCAGNASYGDKNFKNCVAACQTNCANRCEKKYLPGSYDYEFCQTQCNNNGQCLLDNEQACLFGTNNGTTFANCMSQTDAENKNYCLNNAYLCKYGSNEYGGYSDCIDTKECSSTGDYSASYFFDEGKECQKCYVSSSEKANIYSPPAYGTACYGNTSNKGLCTTNIPCTNSTSANTTIQSACPAGQTCINGFCATSTGCQTGSTKSTCPAGQTCQASNSCVTMCPEVSKCPAGSKCPDCSCGQINETVEFSVPESASEHSSETEQGMCRESSSPGEMGDYSTESSDISAYQMVGPYCNDYGYNDDPLTFYCQEDPAWYNDPEREGQEKDPIGTGLFCSKSGEVPIGQTVDAALNWANTLLEDEDNIKEKISDVIDDAKTLGEAKDQSDGTEDYCKCSAKDSGGQPICHPNCQYNEMIIEQSGGGGGGQSSFENKNPYRLFTRDFRAYNYNLININTNNDYKIKYIDINTNKNSFHLTADAGGVCGSGLYYSDASLNSCMTENCCTQWDACVASSKCESCLKDHEGSGCSSNALFLAVQLCYYSGGCTGEGICGTGWTTNNDSYDTCLGDYCCDYEKACIADSSCQSCLESGDCSYGDNSTYKSLLDCEDKNCVGGGICDSGRTTGDDSLDECISTYCCDYREACTSDSACDNCLTGNDCSNDTLKSNTNYKNYLTCLKDNCPDAVTSSGSGGDGSSGDGSGSGGSSGEDSNLICWCAFQPCDGYPCQQMMDYNSELWDDYKDLKETYIDFYINMLTEPRSDIMKKLTYSRQNTNQCSLISNTYDSSARLFSCNRVMDELMPSVSGGKINYDGTDYKSYCYGKDLGTLKGKDGDDSLTDNWFCCQDYSKK